MFSLRDHITSSGKFTISSWLKIEGRGQTKIKTFEGIYVKMTKIDMEGNENKKMQLDVDIEPTFRFSYTMKCIDKQKEEVLAPLTYEL